MIDDLFTDLAVGAVERLLSPGAADDDADVAMARLNARLTGQDNAREGGPDTEARLLEHYSELHGTDLLQIPAAVHEWMLERLSNGSQVFVPAQFPLMYFLYRSFPAATVRHAVVGLLIQADGDPDWIERGLKVPAALLVRQIAPREPPAVEAAQSLEREGFDTQLLEVLTLADLLLDFVDQYPQETERALEALLEARHDEPVRRHLYEWASRIGGEAGFRIEKLAGGASR